MLRTPLTKSTPSRTFWLVFLLFPSTPAGLRSCAWLIALAFSTSFRFTFTRPAGPFASSFRCCPLDISSVLADHDEFFELLAPRGGGSPNSGDAHTGMPRRVLRYKPKVQLSHVAHFAELFELPIEVDKRHVLAICPQVGAVPRDVRVRAKRRVHLRPRRPATGLDAAHGRPNSGIKIQGLRLGDSEM
jgi:hypothetical protein